MRTPDNYDAYIHYEHEQALAESKRPKCAKCGQPIWDDRAYDIDGMWCEECKDDWLREITVYVDDMEDEW